MLKRHGFLIKQWWINGEKQGRTESQIQVDDMPSESESQVLFKGGGNVVKVLGLNWSPVDDRITFCAEINFSRKVKGQRTEPDVKFEEFSSKLPSTLTRRSVLEQVGRIFDPLGLIGPHVLNAKILLRKTWEHNLNGMMYYLISCVLSGLIGFGALMN